MTIEEHVLSEIGKQLDYYVDAYKKVHDLDLRISALSEQIGVLSAERSNAEALRDQAVSAVNLLVEDVLEDDEPTVKALVNERLSSLIGLMVF